MRSKLTKKAKGQTPPNSNVLRWDDALRHIVGLLDRPKKHYWCACLLKKRPECEYHPVRDPEIRKTVARVIDRLIALKPVAEHEALNILKSHKWILESTVPSEEQAWVLADSLHAQWLRSASQDAIASEWAAEMPQHAPGSLDEQRAVLVRSYLARQRLGTHGRARAALRARYLRRAGRALAALVVAAWCVAVARDGREFSDADHLLTMCALAGAIGGSLSGTRSLRIVTKVSETRVFETWWWVQPIVGAAVGMFVYALFSSGILDLPGTNAGGPTERAASWIVYALVAGFSEPFVFGLIDRLSATGAGGAAIGVKGAEDTGAQPKFGNGDGSHTR